MSSSGTQTLVAALIGAGVSAALVLLLTRWSPAAILVGSEVAGVHSPRRRRKSRDFMVDAAEEEDDAATAQTAKLRKEDALRRMREMIPTQTEVKLNNSNMMSMEDIVKSNDVVAQKLAQLTPREVLLKLQQGNSRFWMGLADRPEMSAMERRALIMQQTPKVAVLGCSDSRVPIEIVFDQGLGDIFAIRVAGNVYGGPVKGSVEYAVAVLKVKLVVVMGHEGCGAVRAAGTPMTAEKAASVPLVTELLNEIKSGLDNNRSIDSIRDGRARDREAVVTHVLAQMRRLMKGCEVRPPLTASVGGRGRAWAWAGASVGVGGRERERERERERAWLGVASASERGERR